MQCGCMPVDNGRPGTARRCDPPGTQVQAYQDRRFSRGPGWGGESSGNLMAPLALSRVSSRLKVWLKFMPIKGHLIPVKVEVARIYGILI